MRDKKCTKYTCDCCGFTVPRTENTLPSDWSSLRTPLSVAIPAGLDLCPGCTKTLYSLEFIKLALERRLQNYPFPPDEGHPSA